MLEQSVDRWNSMTNSMTE